MGRPFDTFGDLLLPERKLWDGAYAVALANTARGTRPDRPALRGFDDLMSWSEHVGLLEVSEADALRDSGLPEEDVFAQAAGLRDLAVSIVAAGVRGRRPEGREVEALNGHFADATARLRLRADRDAYAVVLDDGVGGVDRLFAFVSLSLASLLSSGEIRRLRVCDGKGCDLVFVDRGRGPGRRWCDMKTCGSAENPPRPRDRRRRRLPPGPDLRRTAPTHPGDLVAMDRMQP